MDLHRIYYGTGSSTDEGFFRSQGIPIKKEEVFAIYGRVKEEYRNNWISGLCMSSDSLGIHFDIKRYLINGGVIIFHDETMGLIHETKEGLEALAEHFNLPIPVTPPADTSSEII